MTKEAKLIALREESEARSVVSQLGLRRDLRGTYIIQEFIKGKRKTEDLSDKEVEMVLSAWESRHYVPRALLTPGEKMQVLVDNVNLTKEEGEPDKEFDRRKVKHIEKYVRTILAWKE